MERVGCIQGVVSVYAWYRCILGAHIRLGSYGCLFGLMDWKLF